MFALRLGQEKSGIGMASNSSSFASHVVAGEVRRIVAAAIEESGVLSAPQAAAPLLRAHPNLGLALEQVANDIMIAAGRAGVPVEMGHQHAWPLSVEPSSSPAHAEAGLSQTKPAATHRPEAPAPQRHQHRS